MHSHTVLFLVLFLILSLSLFVNAQEEAEFDGTYKIGVVKDRYLKYKIQDEEIFNGTVYFANWVNKNGGL